jgi:hypothetical protein
LIDKLEVRVQHSAPFTRSFNELYRELHHSEPKANPFRPSQLYGQSGDLRLFGFSSILHMHSKWGRGNHKLELLSTGDMIDRDIHREISSVFDVEPGSLEIMRIDLAADVVGVPVGFFHHSARVIRKQWRAEFDDYCYQMGKRGIETLYFGKRPTCIRIYNKIAEWEQEFRKEFRKLPEDAPKPSFEDIYRYGLGDVLTRVERQCGGGKVPPGIKTISDLPDLLDCNPFEALEIYAPPPTLPAPESYSPRNFLAGIGLNTEIRQRGLAVVISDINRRSPGNASRLVKQFREFIPAQESKIITNSELLDRFRESTAKQFPAFSSH